MFNLIKKIKDNIRFNKKGITAKAFYREVEYIKSQNKRLLLAKLATIVRDSTLKETGLLQSDKYCYDMAELLLATYRRNGAVDELYQLDGTSAWRLIDD